MTWTRRSIVLLLAFFLIGALVASPATAASGGELASAAKKKKKKKKKCKAKKRVKKKAKRSSALAETAAKKKKAKCKKKGGGGGGGGSTLPGQPTKPSPTAPSGSGSSSGSGSGSGSGSNPGSPTYQVSGVTLTSNPVLGGNPTQGTVTISETAGEGGVPVMLQSSNSDRASVPSSVHVAAGQTTANFTVTTNDDGPTVAVTLTASIGGSSQQVVLNVVEEPSVVGVELEYQCFPGIGSFAANRVTLDVPAPEDTDVTLGSDNPGLTVPSSVTVANGAISALFEVDVSSPTAIPSVTVTATLDASSADATASVRDGTSPDPVLDGFSIFPSTVAPGGSSTGTVTLDCEAPLGGSTVTLSSDNPNVTFESTGTQNATVTVLEGELSADFQIDVAPLAGSGEVTITATLGNTELETLTIDSIAS